MIGDYPFLKGIHVSCVAASYALFLLRGVWMIRAAAVLRLRWVRIAPHVVDTILLASGIALAVMLRQYPLAAAWLTAKIVALLLYIMLGMIALRWGSTLPVRVTAWISAQATFLYIVAVALTHDPAPWRRW
jgi:uncharacterized membrane protein SirB2